MNKVILGDCSEVMKGFPDSSVDCVVTDPPYGLGFMGKDWDKALPPKQAFIEMCRVLKSGALAFVMSSPRQDLMWRMAQMLEESGFELGQSFISWVYASGFPKAYDVSKGIDSRKGLNRVKKLVEPFGRENRKVGSNQPYFNDDYKNRLLEVSEPASSDAKKWDGWKSVTGLKPALEVIFMVQKPQSEKTIVDNVLKYGVGAINVDACRIPIGEGEPVDLECNRIAAKSDGTKMGLFKENGRMATVTSNGRFPANLLVSDDALNDGKITSNFRINQKGIVNRKAPFQDIKTEVYRSDPMDSGSFSRYFDLDAWAEHHGFLNVPKASTSERERGLYLGDKKEVAHAGHNNQEEDDVTKRFRTQRRNIHPTVKPIKLGAYLCELGCPQNGIILDPFCGSGSFLISAKITGKNYIGIEIESESVEISRARLTAYPTPLEVF